MANDNGLGAPRIHGELQKLGFDVSERTVSRYMPRRTGTSEQIDRWKAFLRNHREGIAAMDFFSVPTITFNVLYVLVVIDHARRRILHFNVTRTPGSKWVAQKAARCVPIRSGPEVPSLRPRHQVLRGHRSAGRVLRCEADADYRPKSLAERALRAMGRVRTARAVGPRGTVRGSTPLSAPAFIH